MSEQGELPGFEKPKKSKKNQEPSFEDVQTKIVRDLGIKLQGEPQKPDKEFSVIDYRTENNVPVPGKVALDQNGNIIWCYEDGKIIWNLDTISKIYGQLHPYQNEIPFVRQQMVEEIARWRLLNTMEEVKKIKERHNIPPSREEIRYNRKRIRGREALLINAGVRKARGRKS